MGTGRLIAVLALLACAAVPVDAAGPKTRYERVLAQEQGLRVQSRRPAPLSQIRKVVAAYESVARRYPTSGYADNALLQAAELLMAAHRIYGSDVDRDAAGQMLQWLVDEYPHSSLITRARQLLRKAKPAERTPASRAAAGAKTPASDATSPTATTAAATPTPSPAAASSTSPPRGSRTLNPTLKQVSRVELADMVRVTFEFDGEFDYKQERLEGPARLYFDLKNTQAVAALQEAAFTYADDTVRHIRLGRPRQDTTRLVIDLAGVENFVVFTLPNPHRLMIDLQRRTPRLPSPIAAKGVSAVGSTAPRLQGASVPRDLDLLKRIPPRPLPHPLADAPRVTTSRRVSAEVASLTRLRPLAANRRGLPMTAPMAAAPRGAPLTADVARLFVVAPLTASRHGLPLNTPASKAPSSHDLTARVARDEAVARDVAAREAAAREAAAREANAREANAREAAAREARETAAREAREVAAREAAARETAAREAAERDEEARAATARDAMSKEAAASRDAAAREAAARKTPLPNRPSGPSTLPAPTAPAANSAGGFSLARQLGLSVARIVIDAGHGGHDPGNLGNKVNESEVVLDVALRLEKLLQKEPGFEVVMTRRTDVFIPLEERTAIANRHQADLFLSIHANSSRNRQASGVETFYLNFATNPEAEALAARENAGAAQTMNHLPEIVRAIAMNNKLDESRDFARVVQEAMVGRLKAQNSMMRDRGVKQAPFVVLIGAGMPSVLAEIAFLTHQQEASLMRTGNYRQKVADALFEAVKNYQRALKSVGTVAAQVDTNDRD